MAKHKDPQKRIVGYYVRFAEWYAVSGLAVMSEMTKSPAQAFRFKYRKDALTWIKDRVTTYEKRREDYRITRIVRRVAN